MVEQATEAKVCRKIRATTDVRVIATFPWVREQWHIDDRVKRMEQFEKDHTASDNSGVGSKNTDKPMSTEEYSQLLREDPAKADEYLRKWTAKEING